METEYIDPYSKTPEELRELWAELGDVAVDDDGMLLEPWLGYEAGTDREEIWHDFDEAYPSGVAALMYPSTDPLLGGAGEDGRAALDEIAAGKVEEAAIIGGDGGKGTNGRDER